MSLTLVGGATGYQRGITSAETAINVANFDLSIKPEVKDFLIGRTGEAVGFAVSALPEAELTIEGEIGGSTGIMAATFDTAFVPANSVTYFGRTGGFYLDSADVKQKRDGWKDITAKLTSKPLIT